MREPRSTALTALRSHGTEYALEAIELGLFMVSACVFALALFHPGSPLVEAVPSPVPRRLLMGLAMGATAVALIHSPMGKRSGAHMNPAVTLTFWRLGKVAGWDAIFYVLAQFAGGAAGVWLVAALAAPALADPSVNYVATVPGPHGVATAWIGEFVISGLLMLVVLVASNHRGLMRYTGYLAGALVATYIFVESPVSGMSMNPARTFGSAAAGQLWTALWIYMTAPPLAMLAASEVYLRLPGRQHVYCAKLHHCNDKPCIFKCGYHRLLQPPGT